MTYIDLAIAGFCMAMMITVVFWLRRHNKTSRSRLGLQTGLRAIDLFCPLPNGGDVLLTGDSGSGVTTLANELAWRFLHDPQGQLHVSYLLDDGLSDLDVRLAEIEQLLPMLSGPLVWSSVSETALQTEFDRINGRNVVLIAVTENMGFQQSVRNAVRQLRETSGHSTQFTLIVVSEKATPADFDAVVTSSKLIAGQGLYPAIEFSASLSKLQNPWLSARQQKTVESAMCVICEVTRSLYLGACKDDQWVYHRDPGKRSALQALCYVTQPYFTAEQFTGHQAVRIPPERAAADFSAILSGDFRSLSIAEFKYRNSLPSKQ